MAEKTNFAESSHNMPAKKRIARAPRLDDHPCSKESKQSYKCLEANAFDKDRCVLYFDNYKNCSSFWDNIRKDRKSKGIKPFMPVPEDRERVKNEFLAKLAKQS